MLSGPFVNGIWVRRIRIAQEKPKELKEIKSVSKNHVKPDATTENGREIEIENENEIETGKGIGIVIAENVKEATDVGDQLQFHQVSGVIKPTGYI